jgi:hypothetical protein
MDADITVVSDLPPFVVREEPATDGSTLYVAWVLNYEGCTGHGATAEEAVEMLRDVLPRFLAAMEEIGAEAVARSRTGSAPSGDVSAKRAGWHAISRTFESGSAGGSKARSFAPA